MKNGSVGELAAKLDFAKRGFEVYSPATDNTTFDFVVHKDGIIETVEVKSTSTERNGFFVVQLKSVRPNRSGNKIHNFDNTKMDYLAVYIEPLDHVVVYRAASILTKTELRVKV